MALEQYSKIADASVDEDSPLDETLMKDGIRDNQEGLRNLIAQGVSWFNWFGGDGSDGAVTETGNGTRALAGGKQYTTYSDGGYTIELTGTNGYQLIGATTSVSITGTVEANGNGCAGGAAGAVAAGDGGNGTDSPAMMGGTGGGGGEAVTAEGNGGRGGNAGSHDGGSAGTTGNGGAGTNASTAHPRWYGIPECNGPGSGGGGGGAGNSVTEDGGAGGAGGGCIVIEADAVTLGAASNIQANGANGSNGGSSGSGGGGGGGGGAGGSILILCRTLTDSGVTTSVTGGSGGTGGTAADDGGAGGSGRVKIIEVL